MGVAPKADIIYTIPARIFVQFMLQNNLIKGAFRTNIYTTERGKNTKTEGNTMTRFEREISGSLGEFWKKNAEEEVRKAVAQADTQATRRNQMEKQRAVSDG